MRRRTFDAMGTGVELLSHADGATAAAAMDRAESAIADLEARFTRFDASSELSRLNRDGVIDASPHLYAAIRLALRARDATAGRFDPAVGAAVIAAGYDRSFDTLPPVPASRPGSPGGADVTLDDTDHRVRLAPGALLDLGGIAKGYAAEVACDALGTAGPCLVNVGGDIAVRGTPPTGRWPIGAETATGTLTIGLRHGGVATSGRDRRHWTTALGAAHHIIDPGTGAPARTDVVRITVVGPDAVTAETSATAWLVAGSCTAMREATTRGCAVVVVTEDGRTLVSEGLR